MHRSVASMLCAAVACAAFAAPAPVYRTPRASGVWVKGWDEPLDRLGDCRFDNKGDRLTLTVPAGKTRRHDVRGGRRDAPCLLRDVEGDFSVRVRVGGYFGPPGGGTRGAGLLLTAGGESWVLMRGAGRGGGKGPVGHRFLGTCAGPFAGAVTECSYPVNSPAGKCHLRVERRGNNLSMHVSEDGATWTAMYEQSGCPLPRRMKVGVAAQAEPDGGFTAVFDQFELTPLK